MVSYTFDRRNYCVSIHLIDENQAKQIAENFLQQHHSILKTRAKLEDGVWSVKIRVSPERTIEVKVNAKTGWILGFQ